MWRKALSVNALRWPVGAGFIFVLVVCPPVWALNIQDGIGAVNHAQGTTQARNDGSARDLKTGGGILYQDTLVTGDASRLNVMFADGSNLFLGDRSELIIDEMVYEPKQFGHGVLRLTSGVFRLISGQINKVPEGELTIITPQATIGVRGTDFWGHQTADRLVMALLDDGELSITTDKGTVVLTDPLSVVTIEKGQAPGAVGKLTKQQLKDAVATISW